VTPFVAGALTGWGWGAKSTIHGDVVNLASHDPCKVEYRVRVPTSPYTCSLSSTEEHERAILEARVRPPQAAYRLVVEKLERRSDKAEKVEHYHPSRSPPGKCW
jgi:hypothetical protein